jgi:hypothetical protein
VWEDIETGGECYELGLEVDSIGEEALLQMMSIAGGFYPCLLVRSFRTDTYFILTFCVYHLIWRLISSL